MISAIILAAGESKRMGQPKMLMPWGKVTVLEHVVGVFRQAGVEDIILVVGAQRARVEEIISQYEVFTTKITQEAKCSHRFNADWEP